jgi:hypothetical protein
MSYLNSKLPGFRFQITLVRRLAIETQAEIV